MTHSPSRSLTSAASVRGWVARHPLPVYVGLAYLFSWAYWWPLLLAEEPVRMGVGWPTQMPGLLGPALAAVVVTGLADGRAGLLELWARCVRWRAGAWWWSVPAILAAGVVGLTATGRLGGVATWVGYNGVPAAWPALATLLAIFLANGVGEELGWRGFAVDRLLRRRSLVATSLLVALVWAPWHLPVFFVMEAFQAFAAADVIGWLIGLTAGSFVLTWLYRGSGGSVLLVSAWHTAFNLTSATPAATGVVAAISSTVVMAAAVVIVVRELRGPHASHPASDAGDPGG